MDPEARQEWTGLTLFVAALLQLVLVFIAYRINTQKTPPYLSTSSWAIFLGIIFGALLSWMSDSPGNGPGLEPNILFFALLPPIILEAGYNTQRKKFFDNFGTIVGLATIGTLIATMVTGAILWYYGVVKHWITELSLAEAMMYGALISAIDPVATLIVLKKSRVSSMLFNLLFGESVLNDAIAIVLFDVFQKAALKETPDTWNWKYISMVAFELLGITLGSILLAVVICYSSAFLLLRFGQALKNYPVYEVSVLLLSAYATYVAGIGLHLSGLLAIFLSGVLIRHYHSYNISRASKAGFAHLLETLAFLSENFIYLYLGASLVAYSGVFKWDWTFILTSFAACMVARAANIFPLCFIANIRRKHPIPCTYMLVMWFSGLRGSIAFALALNIRTVKENEDHAAVLRASTLFTVILTTVVFGMGTGPLLRVLHLSRDPSVQQEEHIEQLLEHTPLLGAKEDKGWFHDIWADFDEKHLKPIFGGRPRPVTQH